MGYAPKQRKVNLKLWLPILIVMILVASFGVYFIMQKQEDDGKYSVCSLSQKQMQSQMKDDYQQTYTVSDYLYYGESLNLLQNAYQVEQSDPLAGKSIILKDLCSDQEYAFVIGTQVDRGILLHNLAEGFYEVFVVEDLLEKRMVYTETVNSSFQTIHRQGESTLVTLKADPNIFSDSEITLPQPYVFIEVTNGNMEQYDVVLDPSGMDHDFTATLNKGGEANGLKEYEATYEAATYIQKQLEEQGLKVLLTKEKASDVVESYGEKGRLAKGYDAKAKYYIRLNFSKTDYGLSGMDITYSNHASDSFASQILYYLKRETQVAMSNDAGVNEGLYQSYPWEGIDGRRIYDSDLWIREAGGKATQAGMYSENAVRENGFAKDNLYGMQAITINLGYLDNAQDASYFKEHKDEYLQVISSSILKYLNVEGE